MGLDECVKAEDFPAWCYAEIGTGSGSRVISIFHVNFNGTFIPYWYDDPENRHLGLPLYVSFKPVLLGDYASFLAESNHKMLFVAICKALNDLPDPLQCVQVIRWLENKGLGNALSEELNSHVINAVNTIAMEIRNRRAEFHEVMRVLTSD